MTEQRELETQAIISEKIWENGKWTIDCTIVAPDGTRRGREFLELPEDATDAQLQAGLLALYGVK